MEDGVLRGWKIRYNLEYWKDGRMEKWNTGAKD